MEMLLKVIYELYTDFVLKNPFYEMEMPIRCELFDLNLAQVIQKDRVALLGRWNLKTLNGLSPIMYLLVFPLSKTPHSDLLSWNSEI